jgi:hypothetical protein
MKTTRSASAASVFWTVASGVLCLGLALFAWLQLPKGQEPIGPTVFFLAGVGLTAWGWLSVRDPRLAMRYYLAKAATVVDLIGYWEPETAQPAGQRPAEADYEHSLHAFLMSELSFAKVTRQYGAARVKCDIAVNSDIFIEIKKGLRGTSKLQRLIGQMELYENEWNGKPIIIVLLGDSDEDLLHDLHRSASKYADVRILVKSVSQ